jgi:predicted signal transduction protein with EAL and GGDEF domain
VVTVTAAAREQRAVRAQLAAQLSVALDLAALAPHGELCVDYVPRVEPGPRRVFGVRARARWLPGEHDPQALAAVLAEDAVLRDHLARRTLLQTCRDTAQWLAAGTAVRVAVELPYTQLIEPAFAELLHLVTDPSFEPALFDLELVDLPPADDIERVAAALRKLRELGVRIALACVDDSRSLGELRRLPLDALRVDSATIERLGPTFVAALARGLDLRIAVTGIDASAALGAVDACEPHELSGAALAAAVSAADVLGFKPDVTGELLRKPTRELAGMLLSIE